MSSNHAYLIGHLGDKPELFKKEDRQALARFSIAVKDTWAEGDEIKEQTDWISVVVYGRRAEAAASHLQKGSKVFVTGKMRTRSYQTKKGETRYQTFLEAQDIQFLSLPKVKTEETPVDNHAEINGTDMPEGMLNVT